MKAAEPFAKTVLLQVNPVPTPKRRERVRSVKITQKEMTQLVNAVAERITGEEERVFPAIPTLGRVLDQNGLRGAIRRALRNTIEISDPQVITAVTRPTEPIHIADLMLDR